MKSLHSQEVGLKTAFSTLMLPRHQLMYQQNSSNPVRSTAVHLRPPDAILPPLWPAEKERGVWKQEEEGGEPGHLPHAIGRQLQPVSRWRRLLLQRRDGLCHAQPIQWGEAFSEFWIYAGVFIYVSVQTFLFLPSILPLNFWKTVPTLFSCFPFFSFENCSIPISMLLTMCSSTALCVLLSVDRSLWAVSFSLVRCLQMQMKVAATCWSSWTIRFPQHRSLEPPTLPLLWQDRSLTAWTVRIHTEQELNPLVILEDVSSPGSLWSPETLSFTSGVISSKSKGSNKISIPCTSSFFCW